MAKPQSHHTPQAPETIDPRWLIKAGIATLVLGVLCAYVTVCTLFWQGQWQLVLHPSRAPEAQPSSVDLAAQPVAFGDGLRGWWITTQSTSPTVLMLPAGDGNAGDALQSAKTLHDLGLNVLLFDYRGFGSSSGQHPEERTMRVDAESAVAFLTSTAKAPEERIIIYGIGAGASIAAELCAKHPEVQGLILAEARGDFAEQAKRDARSSIAPFGLLFREDFPLSDPLHRLQTPKLLISFTSGDAPEIFKRAANPKTTVEIPNAADDHSSSQAIHRFLDSLGLQAPPSLR